jgi:hypothetical protein
MTLIGRTVPSLLAPERGPGADSGKPGRAVKTESAPCIRCGAALPSLSRRRQKVCRVCATQQAQTYLRDALANRRRRPQSGPEDAPPGHD